MSAANGFILVEASPLPGWLQPLRAGPCGAANPLKSLPSELAQTKAENEKKISAANCFILVEASPLPGWLQPLRAGPCGAAKSLKSFLDQYPPAENGNP